MKKSKFNLSHNASLTGDMGQLIPFMVLDCIPNDSFNIRLQSFVRAQPMLAPLMHMVNLYTQYWFVPYRILWDNWTDFITGGLSGSDAPTFPTVKVKPEPSSLGDYFGLPIKNNGTNENPNYQEFEVSALPFRAYAEIWNTRYRDEDLQNEVGISYSDGEDTITNTKLLQPSWAKDYFTTARPFTQRGSQISVPVKNIGVVSGFYKFKNNVLTTTLTPPAETGGASFGIFIKPEFFVNKPDGIFTFTFTFENYVKGSDLYSNESAFVYLICNFEYPNGSAVIKMNFSPVAVSGPAVGGTFNFSYDPNDTLPSLVVETNSYVVDSLDSSVNIRDLRLSSALQRYQERSLEYGNRYEEFIQREFGIKPRDARIQRPEYLGGGKSVLQISEVLQTAEGANTGVGTMRGHGVSAFSSRGIRFRCPEHGVIIGILSIRPNSVYTQGLNRFWRKFSKLDYFVPELANIGMQEVFSSEVFANGSNYNKIFGYSPRYAEYRSQPNRISGEFRTILDYWNLARKFDAEPSLNSDFLTMNPSKRVFAEQTQNSFLIMLRNTVKAYRVVPKTAKNILK